MKFDQIAIAVRVPEYAMGFLKKLGFENWQQDIVTASGEVSETADQTNFANLNFNYQMFTEEKPLEFEYIRYLAGRNFHENMSSYPFISHLGYHTEDMFDEKIKFKKLGISIIQEVKTISHTNANIQDGRSYHYVIFDTIEQCGFYIKAIKRNMK